MTAPARVGFAPVATFGEKTEMRVLFAMALALVLAGCAMPVSCEDPPRDGGIGGTGSCETDAPEDVLAALQP